MNSPHYLLFPLQKLKNIILVFFSYQISRIIKHPITIGQPITISVEPINQCNLSCPECPVGRGSMSRKPERMTIENYSTIIKKIAPQTAYLTLYFQGEPLLHKDFTQMAAIAKEYKIYTASSTNAQLLSNDIAKKIIQSGLNKLIVSIDGTTQEVYEKYRIGGSLQRATEGIQSLLYWKKELKSNTPFVELQFLVLKHNEHQIDEIKQLAKKLGVNKLSLKTAQIIDFEDGSELIPSISKYARYKKIHNGKYIRKKKVCNKCWRAFSGAVITVNGDVLPCSYDKNGEYAFGNIHQQSLKEIWHNDKAKQFRQQILSDRKAYEICRNCTE